MPRQSDATFTPEFLRDNLKVMAEMNLSERTAEMYPLFAGLVATMNMLQPEGYDDTMPAFTFKPIKE